MCLKYQFLKLNSECKYVTPKSILKKKIVPWVGDSTKAARLKPTATAGRRNHRSYGLSYQ